MNFDIPTEDVAADIATLACTPQGLQLIDLAEGLGLDELRKMVGLPILPG